MYKCVYIGWAVPVTILYQSSTLQAWSPDKILVYDSKFNYIFIEILNMTSWKSLKDLKTILPFWIFTIGDAQVVVNGPYEPYA